ncbi:MAG TPA: CheR family methyltransferase [Myxococcaceae bacterium]
MARFDDDRPEMSAEEFRLLRDLVYERSGISIRDDLKFVMERRLWPRLEALGLTDFAAYHRHLRLDPRGAGELDFAIEALATNETYFFREPHQLRAFSEEILPRLEEQNRATRRLRIWSAGCSTGEEPYTLAMLIKESGRFEGWDVQVLGTDISRKVLTSARRAEYGPSSMRAMPEGSLERYFLPAGARWQLREDVRSLVTFGHLNLVEFDLGQLVARQDAVFCRNVLIYFDLPARRRVLDLFYARLHEGGYLLLGHSESLINLTSAFELVHLKSDLVYRKPRGPSPAPAGGRP